MELNANTAVKRELRLLAGNVERRGIMLLRDKSGSALQESAAFVLLTAYMSEVMLLPIR